MASPAAESRRQEEVPTIDEKRSVSVADAPPEEDPLAAITCPLSHRVLMTDPVAASDGHVYERSALINFLEGAGTRLSPSTNKPMTDRTTDLRTCPVTAAVIDVSRTSLTVPPQRVEQFTAETAMPAFSFASPSVMDKLERWRTAVKDQVASGGDARDLVAPTIAVVGQRNAGKSTLLEALIGVAVLPRRSTTAVVHVELKPGPVVVLLMRVVPTGTATTASGAGLPWRRIPAAILTEHGRLPDVVEHVMSRLAADTRVASGHSVSTDCEIQLVVQTPTAPPLHLLDLPGVVSEGNPGHEDVEPMLKAAIERVKGTARFLWAHSAVERSANSSVGALLRECGVADRTTGVLTNCDRVRNDDPDVADVTGIAELLRDDAAEHSRAVGGGWFAVANASRPDEPPSTRLRNMPQREASTLQRLQTPPSLSPEEMFDGEVAQFHDDVALVSACWGMDRLRQHEQTAYEAFAAEHWGSDADERILQRLDAEHTRLRALGVPFAVSSEASAAATEGAEVECVRRFVARHASELPAALAVWDRSPASAAQVAVAITEAWALASETYSLAAAPDEAMHASWRNLDVALRSMAASSRAFFGDGAAHAALDYVDAQTRAVDSALAGYCKATRAWFSGAFTDSFIGFAAECDERRDDPVRLDRFGAAQGLVRAEMQRRIRDAPALDTVITMGLPTDAALRINGDPFGPGPYTVRCSDPERVRARAAECHWQVAAAVRKVLLGTVAAIGETPAEALACERELVARERIRIIERCAGLCRRYEPSATPTAASLQEQKQMTPSGNPRPLLRHFTDEGVVVGGGEGETAASPPPSGGEGGAMAHFTGLKGLVDAVGDGLLADNRVVTHVTLEGLSSVTSAGERFMSGCTSLEAVDVGPLAKLRSAAPHLLSGCTSLRSMDFSSLVELQALPDHTARECTNLQSVTLSGMTSLARIGDGCLGDLASLTVVELSGGLGRVSELGDGVLSACPALTSVDLSGLTALTSIGHGMLENATSLTSVDLSALRAVVHIGDAFLRGAAALTTLDCSRLTSLERVGNNCLCDLASLTSANLTGLTRLENVGDRFLFGARSLADVDLSALESLRTVGKSFVCEASALRAVTLLPRGLQQLESAQPHLFSTCPALVEVDWSGPQHGLTVLEDCTLCLCEALTCINLSGLGSVGRVGSWCLFELPSLTRLDLSGLEKVTEIGNCFLYGAKSLTSVDLSSLRNVSKVGASFMALCHSLKTLDLAPLGQLAAADDFFLLEATSLTKVRAALPSLAALGKRAFAKCTALVEADLRPLNRLASLGPELLAGCPILTRVHLPRLAEECSDVAEALKAVGGGRFVDGAPW